MSSIIFRREITKNVCEPYMSISYEFRRCIHTCIWDVLSIIYEFVQEADNVLYMGSYLKHI